MLLNVFGRTHPLTVGAYVKYSGGSVLDAMLASVRVTCARARAMVRWCDGAMVRWRAQEHNIPPSTAEHSEVDRPILPRGIGGIARSLIPPHRLRRPTPPATIETIERLRHQRWTVKQIAVEGVSPATLSRVLRRLGLNELSGLLRQSSYKIAIGL